MLSEDLFGLAEWIDGRVLDYALARTIICALNKAATDAMAMECVIVPLAARNRQVIEDGTVIDLGRRLKERA